MKCFKCGLLAYMRREKKEGEREREGRSEAVNVKRKGKGLSRISSYRLEKSSQQIYNQNFQSWLKQAMFGTLYL